MSDFRIERDVVIEAPPDVVWKTITEPDQITGWFADRVELDLKPGGHGYLGFGKDVGTAILVEVVDEPRPQRGPHTGHQGLRVDPFQRPWPFFCGRAGQRGHALTPGGPPLRGAVQLVELEQPADVKGEIAHVNGTDRRT